MPSLVKTSLRKALGGGLPGAAAMVLQVFLLMWMRTTINYQHKHGGTVSAALTTLYAQGGIGRFYQGLGPALLQGPLSRFGDTAANEGIKSLLSKSGLHVGLVTLCASLAAATWRITITPIDTLKTFLQVEGKEGFAILLEKIQKFGILSLYNGWAGTWLATLVGHYPWFFTFNFLDNYIRERRGRVAKLLRRAFIGFCSSLVSDFTSNSIRVIKTYVQTSTVPIGYVDAIGEILEKEGLGGLMFRGLGIKIISNGISAMLFTVMWKALMEMMEEKQRKNAKFA